MIDMDAAIGFVVAKGDAVERARLSFLRTGAAPHADVLARAEVGQAAEGGWPAVWGQAPSVDATCFHLAELDDLGALDRPAARKALDWLASRQAADGTWEEDEALATEAPSWARPGDPEAKLFLTANAGFWLTVAGLDGRAAAPPPPALAGAPPPPPSAPLGAPPPPPAPVDDAAEPARAGTGYAVVAAAAAQALADSLAPDGTWPSFLATGWLGAAVLFHHERFYESARMQIVLGERLSGMPAGDVAWMAARLRRVGVDAGEWLLVAARRRLAETQRSDGGWPSEDGTAFDVHTTLTAIRACR